MYLGGVLPLPTGDRECLKYGGIRLYLGGDYLIGEYLL